MRKQSTSTSGSYLQIVRGLCNRRFANLLAVVMGTVLFTVAAHGLSSRSSSGSGQAALVEKGGAGSLAAGNMSPQGPVEEVKVRLSTSGFEPGEITRNPSPFYILVDNVNVTGEYTLQMKAENGTVIKEVKVQKGSAGWSVNLGAGHYILTEAGHPQWTCRIIVQ